MLQGNTVANVNIDRGSKKIIQGKYSKNNSYLELKQEPLLYCSVTAGRNDFLRLSVNAGGWRSFLEKRSISGMSRWRGWFLSDIA